MPSACCKNSLTAFLIASAWLSAPHAQGDASPAETHRLDSYGRAHALVRAAYPSLSSQQLMFTITQDRWRSFDEPIMPLTAFVLTVGRRNAIGRANRRNPQTSIDRVFSAHIEFTLDETLYDFGVDSEAPFINRARIERLGRMLASQPDSTAAQVAAVFTSAGARFGPDHQRNLEVQLDEQLERIGKVLGPVRRAPIQFHSDDNSPRWAFDVIISTPVGERTYSALAEPFEGQLYGLGRVGRQ